MGGGLDSLLVWPFARNFWSLAIYSLAFGATAGGLTVLRPRIAAAIVGDDQTVASAPSLESDESDDASRDEEKEARQKNKFMFIFGVFTAARGIGIVSSGFVTEALVHENSTDLTGYGSGTKWRNLTVFTGVTMIVASLGALGKFVPYDVKIGAESRTS